MHCVEVLLALSLCSSCRWALTIRALLLSPLCGSASNARSLRARFPAGLYTVFGWCMADAIVDEFKLYLPSNYSPGPERLTHSGVRDVYIHGIMYQSPDSLHDGSALQSSPPNSRGGLREAREKRIVPFEGDQNCSIFVLETSFKSCEDLLDPVTRWTSRTQRPRCRKGN
jgi:hypothetical protein